VIRVRLATWGCATLFAGSALAGCSVWGPEGGPGGSGLRGPTASAAPPVDAVAGPDGVQRVEVTAGDDLRFTPSVVRAHPGVIEFVFRNTGSTPHDARVQSTASEPLGDTGNLNGGQSATVRVTVTAPGTYPFPCLYHESSGMVGQLIVAP
jgi:plastocyanin